MVYQRSLQEFVEDLICPLSLHQPGLRNADQQVPRGIAVQRTRVVRDDERHRSVRSKLLIERVSSAIAALRMVGRRR